MDVLLHMSAIMQFVALGGSVYLLCKFRDKRILVVTFSLIIICGIQFLESQGVVSGLTELHPFFDTVVSLLVLLMIIFFGRLDAVHHDTVMALDKRQALFIRRSKEQSALLAIGKLVQGMQKPDDLKRVVKGCLYEVQQIGLDVQSMAIHRIQDPEKRLVETFRAGTLAVDAYVPNRKSTSLVKNWQQQKIKYMRDTSQGVSNEWLEELSRKFNNLAFRSFVDVPFSRGMISAHSANVNAFSDSDIKVLENIAEIFTVGFSRAEDLQDLKKRSEELQASEAKYRALVENADDVIVLTDLDGKYLYRNEAYYTSLGYEIGEEIKSDYTSEIHQEDASQPKLSEFLEQGVTSTEYGVLHKNGNWIHCASKSVVIYDDNNRPTSVLSVIRDITEQKWVEELLRESEAENRAIIETVVDGIITISEQGIVEAFNPAAEKIFGYEAQEVIGKNVSMLMPEPYHSGHDAYLQNYRETGTAKVIGIGREVVGLRKDGAVFPMELSVGMMEVNDKRSFVGIIHDITKRKEAEEAILASEDQLRTVTETARDAIISTDRDGYIIFWSGAAEDMFGHSADEVMGKVFMILIPTRYHKPYTRRLKRILEHQQATSDKGQRIELIGVRKSGNEFPTELSLATWHKDGQFYMSAIVRDISERKEAEVALKQAHDELEQRVEERTQELTLLNEQLRQAQKMEAIGQMAGGIAHDFNNLLTAINGYSKHLLNCVEDTDPMHNGLEQIHRAGGRAAELTRQLLAFSRKQVLKPEVLNLNHAICDMEDMLRDLIGDGIELRTLLAPQIHNVNADPTQVEQVVMNLVINARDAMSNGGHITLKTADVYLDEAYVNRHKGAKVGSYVMLSVGDVGGGIDKETLSHIFEPFFTTKDRSKGTGLGLAMVYGIVKQSEGYIEVESEVGEGTTFKIFLPRVDDLITIPHTEKIHGVSGGTETILLVEDEEMVRNLAYEILIDSGYTVLSVSCGQEAIRLCEAQKNPIDLLVTDVIMPKMSGRELSEHLSRILPELKVLYMSGYIDKVLGDRGILDEGVELIQKPFSPDDMIQKIRHVLNG